MKKIGMTFIIVLFTSFGMNAQKAMDRFFVQVDGLGCPFCAYGLEKKFKEFKGIKDVKIDIETGNFSFSYPAEKELTLKAVEKQVEKAGYTPITSKIERANGAVEASGVSKKTSASDGETVSKEIRVAGNCEMCKARIESTVNALQGVNGATWDKDTKLLLVNFDPKGISIDDVEKSVAKAGHDTQNHKAHPGDYESLPACCKYERIK